MDEEAYKPRTPREIIEQARRDQSKRLDLSAHRLKSPLTQIPAKVFLLSNLEDLELHGNNIHEVPEKIRNLPKLSRLSVVANPIAKVPDIPGLALDWAAYLRCRGTLSRQNVEEIYVRLLPGHPFGMPETDRELFLLTNLRRLKIWVRNFSFSQQLFHPPPEIGILIDNLNRFKFLETLYTFGIFLGRFPEGIRGLKQLRHIWMTGAGLSEVPEWLGDLCNLRSLGLNLNHLKELPLSLKNLPLEKIDLEGNLFTEIPKVIFEIQSLEALNIAGWIRRPEIKRISADILRLPRLKQLKVDPDSIEIPPPEIVKEGVEGIKNYWRQQSDVGIDYLCEAKLIILGEAGAGKTTLAKKIQNPQSELDPQERSTEGIDVVRWSFPAAIRVKREGGEELHHADFKVNIWDFGGQEIYHATHQFFLTRRSVYALVADDRKEDTDFNYWLQIVELLSDRSPLLIVQNEKQDRQRDIDVGKLRADFPNLRREFRTNLATNRGLSDLTRAIRQELEYLPHIGTPLPKTWSRVRAALETDPRNYLSLEEYLAICQKNGFERRYDKLQLSGYLHDLGICLHFQDDPVLKNIVILKPKWGTDAVYHVLDDPGILNKRGRFGPQDLTRIWSDNAYADKQDELLRLMMKFQLCYQIPGMETYIAPQLLSPTRPVYEWGTPRGLVLRYDYDFMPKGILTRFIVAVNHLIGEQNLVWKSGVILRREDSRAEVIEDYSRRKITVRVNGADARSLLAIVDDQIERIHASFSRLNYEKFLPCNCETCKAREEPFAYPLSELKDFAAQGDKIQCRVSRKLVDAANLIKEVLPSVAYSPGVSLSPTDFHYQEDLLPAKPPLRKEVFVSYAWSEESTTLVDRLQEAFKGRDIAFIRDKSEMQYKDSIRDFMKRIGSGKCIIAVLSKKYLESKSCMFELTEIADHGEIRHRVFPIILADAAIYDAIGRIRYIKHWERKKQELDREMKGISGEHLQGIREELDLYAKIRGTIAGIVDILGDMNALSLSEHQESSFGSLLKALEMRLSE